MELLLEASCLERFLNPRPKVIVAACDRLAAVCLDALAELLFDVWVFTSNGAAPGTIRLQASSIENVGRLVAAPNPPAAMSVLAAETDPACADLEELRAWWAATGPQPAGPVLRCRAGEAAADILRVLLRATRQELLETTAQVASTTAQLYQLHCEYEQMRVAADSLQKEIGRYRCLREHSRVNLPLSGSVYAPLNGKGTLVQPLPVSAEGFAGLDLHFPAAASMAGAQILVRLHAADMGRDLGLWRLTGAHLGKGWVHCWLPEVLAVASHDLEVHVEWLTPGGLAPPISLASFSDWPEWQARSPDSNTAIDGCLALTAWQSAPGIPLKSGPVWCSAAGDGSLEYILSAGEIVSMQVRTPADANLPREWYPFQIRPDGSFMLHPFGQLATTLRLDHVCFRDVDRVTAQVKITSPLARGDVQYAVAVSTSDEAETLMDGHDLASDPHFQAFSDWHTIPRDGAAHTVVMDFTKPAPELAQLILATRMPPGEDHGWAWADWLELRFRLGGRQAMSCLETSKQRWAA